jgi:hypothetical protein
MATKVGYAADIYITSTPSVAFTQEATTADGGRLNYTITNTAKRYWDRGVSVLVENSTDAGATWHAAPPYTLNYCGGIVTFATARAVGELCRVSGNYYPWAQLGNGKSWELSLANALVDTSVFGSGWKTFTPVVLGGTVKMGRWWLDSSFLTNLANPLVAVLYVNQAAGTRYEGFVRLKVDSVKTAVAGVIDQTLEFELDGAINYYP